MNFFMYKGIRSSDMGLRIESKNVFSAPAYEVDFLSIPGRDGDLIAGGGRYSNVQVTYSVFLPAKTLLELSKKITAVKSWLYTQPDRYHLLSDTYDSNFFRYGVFNGKLDIEDLMNRIGVFTISFSCKTYRYDTNGMESIDLMTAGEVITNPYPFISRPVLRIEGNGEGTLTIQSEGKNATWGFTNITGFVDVDSEQMNFYKDTQPMNNTVTGDGFPLLYPGENTFTFSGGITSISVIPRWCCL